MERSSSLPSPTITAADDRDDSEHASIAVVTLMKEVGDTDIPQFTTTLIVRDDGPPQGQGPR